MTQNKPFQRHSSKFYGPRPSWNRQATINGRPAYEAKSKEEAHETHQA